MRWHNGGCAYGQLVMTEALAFAVLWVLGPGCGWLATFMGKKNKSHFPSPNSGCSAREGRLSWHKSAQGQNSGFLIGKKTNVLFFFFSELENRLWPQTNAAQQLPTGWRQSGDTRGKSGPSIHLQLPLNGAAKENDADGDLWDCHLKSNCIFFLVLFILLSFFHVWVARTTPSVSLVSWICPLCWRRNVNKMNSQSSGDGVGGWVPRPPRL